MPATLSDRHDTSSHRGGQGGRPGSWAWDHFGTTRPARGPTSWSRFESTSHPSDGRPNYRSDNQRATDSSDTSSIWTWGGGIILGLLRQSLLLVINVVKNSIEISLSS